MSTLLRRKYQALALGVIIYGIFMFIYLIDWSGEGLASNSQCFVGRQQASKRTIRDIAKDYSTLLDCKDNACADQQHSVQNKKKPKIIELSNLYDINQHQSKNVACQIGFDPFLVMAQIRINPESLVYAFHTFNEVAERAAFVPRINSLTSRFVPIAGNPMQTVREFARQFGRGKGLALNTHFHQTLKEVNYNVRDLYVDDIEGFACDIVHIADAGELASDYILLSALIAHENTTIVYHGDGSHWTKAVDLNVVQADCSEGVVLHYGHYLRPYATTLHYDHQPTYDVQDMIAEYMHALKDALFNATQGKTKRVVWIPVAYPHKHFADILYCSLRSHGVDNYLFFALDQAIHDYFVAQGRHSLYSGKWYTQLGGSSHYYHSHLYNMAMRERYTILRDVMDLGYEMLLNDADIFWVTNVLEDLKSDADLIAQFDTGGDGTWGELCGGFVLHKVRPGTIKFFELAQQLAFLMPEHEDQQITNALLESKYACQRLVDYPFNATAFVLTGDQRCPKSGTHLVEVELKDPRLYVGGHFYCRTEGHELWEKEHVRPKLIHLNGPYKDQCVEHSKEWGYEMRAECT
eukprot:TRINITY_DN1947_c0_g1_i2.p1 TRINITY_DN1947_c0_g1~~TRINITY_DN1947_c0_g1_i2.p1  ORF type:complete len:578 (-),score=98.32 TRINITY_DN1947_c0_g1_i2:134-1867(-)